MKLIGHGQIQPKDKSQLWYRCNNWIIIFRTTQGKISKDFEGTFSEAQEYKNYIYQKYSADYSKPKPKPAPKPAPAQNPAPAQQPAQKIEPAQQPPHKPAPAQQPAPVQKAAPAQNPAPAQQPAQKPAPVQQPNILGKSLSLSYKNLSDRNKPVDRNIYKSKIVVGYKYKEPNRPATKDKETGSLSNKDSVCSKDFISSVGIIGSNNIVTNKEASINVEAEQNTDHETKPNIDANTPKHSKPQTYKVKQIINKVSTSKVFSTKKIVIAIIVAVCLFAAVFAFNVYINNDKNDKSYNQIQLQDEEKAKEEEKINAEEQAKAESKRIYTQMRSEKAKKAAKNIKSLGTLYKSLDVPLMHQYPTLPCGCESVALTNQLNYYGFNLSLTTIADVYMPYSDDDFVNAYVGDPYSETDGATIMAPGLTATANNFLNANSTNLYAYDVTGLEFTDLFKYIERGHPVQIWVTQQMIFPDDAYDVEGGFKFTMSNHCVLLTGFDKNNNTVEITDSIYGLTYYSIESVKSVWDYLGHQAVVILTDKEIEAFLNGKDSFYVAGAEAAIAAQE